MKYTWEDNDVTMLHTVFVYGTLKRGHRNYAHFLMGRSEYIGPAQTVRPMFLQDGGFPRAYFTGPNKLRPIMGEVYRVDDKVLALLDRLEGVPTFYQRHEVDVNLKQGTIVKAQMYVMKGRGYRPGAPVVRDCYRWTGQRVGEEFYGNV